MSAFKWHIVGDSHVGAMIWAADHGLMSRPCSFTVVNGATAVGLRNPNAKTEALDVFRRDLMPVDPNVVPVVHLGEVDCGFVIWYRAAKYGDPVVHQLASSVSAYFGFVDELLLQGFVRIVVSACSLPTIRDGIDWGEVANARREVRQPLRQRTELTLDYNRRLAVGAAARPNVSFIDVSHDVLDPATGLVRDDFRHPDVSDHHLDPAKLGPLWADRLNHLGADQDAS